MAADFEALLAQAKIAVKESNLLEAIDLYEEVIEQNPDDFSAHEGLATACYLAQDYPGAIKHFTRVTQLQPRDAKAYINLGALHNLQQDYKQAADVLRKAVQRDGRNPDVYYNLGIVQRNLRQFSMAVSAYRECLRLDPEMVDAHVNIANVYLEQNNHRKAVEHYEKALGVKPGYERARRGLDHVRGIMDKNKREASPFGRLVDVDKLVAKDAKIEAGRVLSDDERFEDRQLIQLATAEAGTLAANLRVHLRDHVEPALLTLSRILAQNPDSRHGLYEAYSAYHEAKRFAMELFQNWLVEHHRLKKHEADMKP